MRRFVTRHIPSVRAERRAPPSRSESRSLLPDSAAGGLGMARFGGLIAAHACHDRGGGEPTGPEEGSRFPGGRLKAPGARLWSSGVSLIASVGHLIASVGFLIGFSVSNCLARGRSDGSKWCVCRWSVVRERGSVPFRGVTGRRERSIGRFGRWSVVFLGSSVLRETSGAEFPRSNVQNPRLSVLW